MDRMFSEMVSKSTRDKDSAEKSKAAAAAITEPPAPAPDPVVTQTTDPAPVSDPDQKPEAKPVKGKTKTRHIATQAQTPEELTEIVTKAAVKAVTAAMPERQPEPPVKATPAAPTVALPEMFSDREELWGALERANPKKYGSGKLVGILAESAKRISAYQASWEQSNPGSKFVASDHEQELSDLSPEIPESDLRQAEIKLGVERELAPIRERENAEKQSRELKNIQESSAPNARKNADEIAKSIFGQFDSELVSALDSKDKSKIDAYAESNPEIYEAASQVGNTFGHLTERASLLLSPGGERLYNPSNQADVILVEKLIPGIQEALIGTESDDGKTFVDVDQFIRMSPAQKKIHATIDLPLVLSAIKKLGDQKAVEMITGIRKREEQILKRNGFSKTTKAAPVATATIPPEPAAPAPISSASGVSAPRSSPASVAGPGSQAHSVSIRDRLIGDIMGRSVAR